MSNNIAGTVNDQTVDSVSQISTFLVGNSAPQAMGLLDVAGAESMGMSMHNAVSTQQNSQISSAAAVTAACAKMLSINQAIPAPPADEKAPPPPFMPLGPNGNVSADAMLKQANTLAESALKMLQDSQSQQKDAQSGNEQEVKDLITKLQAFQSPATKKATTTDTKDDGDKVSGDAGKKQENQGSQ